MTIPQLTDEAVKVALLSAKCRSGLVVHTLSKHFGLSIDDAEVLMKRGSGTIAKRISARLANETKPLLLALGLKIAILPVGAEADEHLCDVFIRVTNAERASPVIRVLRRHLELDPACLERFAQIGRAHV